DRCARGLSPLYRSAPARAKHNVPERFVEVMILTIHERTEYIRAHKNRETPCDAKSLSDDAGGRVRRAVGRARHSATAPDGLAAGKRAGPVGRRRPRGYGARLPVLPHLILGAVHLPVPAYDRCALHLLR